jgi:hypothetical protein
MQLVTIHMENDEMTVLDEKVEEITTEWDAGDSKYLCFYRTAFPFMKDSWGVDWSNSREELLEKQWALFSIASLRDHAIGDETFSTVLDILSTDPQIILCSDGEYQICGYSRSPWGWIVVPVKFNKLLYRQLSCECRRAKSRGYQLFRDNMIALDDDQFKLAQRVAREVYGLEIWDIGQIEEVNGEASCQSQ